MCGGAGCGKTLFGIEFLVRGATQFNEPGVFISFEETNEELTRNVSSLGFDLKDLVKHKKISLDHVHVERSEIEETGFSVLPVTSLGLNHTVSNKRISSGFSVRCIKD